VERAPGDLVAAVLEPIIPSGIAEDPLRCIVPGLQG
jgi:hypothetical protein